MPFERKIVNAEIIIMGEKEGARRLSLYAKKERDWLARDCRVSMRINVRIRKCVTRSGQC